jgi:energy-coupling factor transport system substrate-specific component
MFFMVVGVLLWQTLSEINLSGRGSINPVTKAFLLRATEYIQTDLLPRLDRFLGPELNIKSIALGKPVAAWALISVLGNISSAVLLLYVVAASLRADNRFVGAIIIFFSALAVLLSIIATPLLFGTLHDRSGAPYPIDISVITIAIFFAYLLVDVISLTSLPKAQRRQITTVIASIDVPCFLATLVFVLCNAYSEVPSSFAVGVSAGLFVLYSIAFLSLCWLFWINSRRGVEVMRLLKGPAVGAIVLGAALNGAIGLIVQFAKLPIYLDLVGSILVSLLYGPLVGTMAAIVGILVVGSMNPLAIAYVGTAVGVTVAAWYLKRLGYGNGWFKTIALGTLVLGPLSSILSIPVTTYLFGGVTFVGSDYITALFRAGGASLLESVSTGAFLFDALDKGLTSALVYFVYLRAPARFKKIPEIQAAS